MNHRWFKIGGTLLPALFVALLATTPITQAVSPNLVISQVYGGGGNSGAPYLNDFIEIFNRGSMSINVNGWSVQYASATASSWSVTPLPNLTVPPGGYMLIQEASSGPNGASLPTPDAMGTINLASTTGKVALVNTTTALAVANPVGLPQVVDFVGYGTSANGYEGGGPAPTLSSSKSAIRNLNGCVDSDNNSADFSTSDPPTPRNSLTLANPCSAPPVISSPVWIVAFYYAGYIPDGSGQGDEAIELMNVTTDTVDLSGWAITDFEGESTFPPSTTLPPGQRIWVARRATDFRTIFGYKPQYELTGSDASVPNMVGSTPPTFADPGDEIVLKDNLGNFRDVVVYGAGSTVITGWVGAAVQPYNVFPMNDPHQVIYRRLDKRTGYPLTNTHTESDWSVSKTCAVFLYGPVRDCDLSGKKPMAPGWHTGLINPNNSLTDDWVTFKVTETANLSVLVGPDHLYDYYVTAINSAEHSIAIEGYTLHNPDIVAALAARAAAGITVTILLEGEPCCNDPRETQENLWAARQISDAVGGPRVWFMANLGTSTGPHYDRYNNQHAKFTLIDVGYPTQQLLVGTENLDCTSMASDYKGNGTAGNRGYYLRTNAPSVIAYYQRIFNLDLDMTQQDIVPYGVAPYVWDGVTVPAACGDGTSYMPVRRLPLNLSGTFPFEVVQCPDNCLHYDESLIGMVRQAGAGDVLLVEQAYERLHWGASSSSIAQDPNPRLEAYIDAARRGAAVRILLDAKYDSITSTVSNSATIAYVNSFSPTLNIEARLSDLIGGNAPAGNGIHAKVVMLNSPSRRRALVHIGSINGSENSSKFNREMALQVPSTEAFCYMYDIFRVDWQASGGGDLDSSGLRGNCPPFVPAPVLDKPVWLPLIRK